MAYSTGFQDKTAELLTKTEIVAGVQHPMEALADPYPVEHDDRPFGYISALELLQKQLQHESETGWKLACLPRIYKVTEVKIEENGDAAMADGDSSVPKHAFPSLAVPTTVSPGHKPIYPETYFSIYAEQDIETVPKMNNIAASLIRDTIADTINVLDFNRNAVAKFLIELDCFFAPGTFAARGTAFDKIRDIPAGQPTWKPEDMVVDAIFAQMLLLPSAEHKLVFYHSVITESCKLAPAAIAPTLGRAIRYLYRSIDYMDLELAYRFLDWFSHHLSNFDFRWKWAEWTEDVDSSAVSMKKAFIVAAIDKEIRLSFTKRIRETLPKEYHKLIPTGKEKDVPDFKFNNPGKSIHIYQNVKSLTCHRHAICD
jgi:nuclear cap-binding protein subunit 1